MAKRKSASVLLNATFFLAVIATGVALMIGAMSCASNPTTGETELDLPLLHDELEQIELDLADITVLLGDTDPDLAEVFSTLTQAVDVVNTAVEARLANLDTTLSLGEAVQEALIITAPLVELVTNDPDKQVKARLTVVVARAILRRVELEL